MNATIFFSPIAARLRFQRFGPSSPKRVEWFANTLRDAYFERQHRVTINSRGKTLKRPVLDTAGLLAKIARMIERETARSGDPAAIQVALRTVFNASDADDLRSSIIHLVEGGDMKPSEAAYWADIFGWRSFTKWADPALFDPMKVPMWTLAMTAAWICWRERDQVRRRWPVYLEASTHWIETEDGHEIGPRTDQGYFEIPEETTDTMRTLCEALESGQLAAQRYKGGAFVEIRSSDWAVLRIVGFHDEDGVHKVIAPDGESFDAYVQRDDLLAAFPASASDEVAPGAQKPPASEAPLKKKAVAGLSAKSERLVELMLANPGATVLTFKEFTKLVEKNEPLLAEFDRDTFSKIKSAAKDKLATKQPG